MTHYVFDEFTDGIRQLLGLRALPSEYGPGWLKWQNLKFEDREERVWVSKEIRISQSRITPSRMGQLSEMGIVVSFHAKDNELWITLARFIDYDTWDDDLEDFRNHVPKVHGIIIDWHDLPDFMNPMRDLIC